MGRTIIISNRLPLSISMNPEDDQSHPVITESIGGLATGLKSIHEQEDSLWMGWCGIPKEELGRQQRKDIDKCLVEQHKCQPVHLTAEQIDNFYYGFCNETIWPLFHYFPQTTNWEQAMWDSYLEVNSIFFKSIKNELKSGDTIWVHDYQLMLLPEMIRKEYPDINIGFFLHIPFPSYEIFRLMPWREEILKGILGANLIGFHTYDYVRHFLSSARRLLGLDNSFGRILLDNHCALADAFPMGIDYDRFKNESQKHRLSKDHEVLLKNTEGKQLVLSVDRLDYTKGIPERISAFEKFLDDNPEYHEKVQLIMIAAPSRTEVNAYKGLKKEVQELVGHVNGKLGKIGWTPIWFYCQCFSFEELVTLYKISDCLLVTPLRDGMNLVVKEYIAAKTDFRGAVVLSETAGASNELGEAIVVNPNNCDEISAAIKKALEMPAVEQISRNKTMHERLSCYSVQNWADDFLNKLIEESKTHPMFKTEKYSAKIDRTLKSGFQKAKKRLLIFDYDGTLTPLKKYPDQAAPDDKLLSTLVKCAENPLNTVLIISGRKKEDLQKWFGALPLDLSAEHGLWTKSKGKNWKSGMSIDDSWKSEIGPIIESFVLRTPRSFIEEKTIGLAWHYRNCEPEQAKVRLNELWQTLMGYIQNLHLSLLDGNKVLEVRDANINKGTIAKKWLSKQSWDFILCAGDDVTDEDMFNAMPPGTFSFKVGVGQSTAQYHVNSSNDIVGLLSELTEL